MPRSLAALLPTFLAFGALSSPSAAQTTIRVSVDSAGVQANGSSDNPAISADGHSVAFTSGATNLVAGDTNGQVDVFVRNLQTGTTNRVSVDSAGLQATASSSAPAINGDGRVVAFASSAANLVSGDANGAQDVFVHDLLSGTTVRASVTSAGVEGNGSSSAPSISADGRFVAFQSNASNLVVADTNGVTDIFVKDLATGVVTRVSVDSAGTQGNGSSTDPSISGDGRYVAFTSSASNLVFGDSAGGYPDVFVYDRLLGNTVRASVTPGGGSPNGFSESARLSADGRFVAFACTATNIVSPPTNGLRNVFLRDLVANMTTRVSLTYLGGQPDEDCYDPAVSGDGRYVTFTSFSAAILPGGVGVFLRDTQSASVQRVSVTTGGLPANNSSGRSSISGDGSTIAYYSSASNLVPADTNAVADIFLTDPVGTPWVAYCFGDGSATACPCGNTSPSAAAAGCLNSTGNAGQLVATGFPSITSDTIVLTGTGMTNGPGLYFQGTAQFAGGFGAVLGDGLRCAGGTLIRLGIQPHAAGSSYYPGAGDPAVSVKGACAVGNVRTYQVWYRDAATFCAPETYSLSNGLALAWRP